MNTSIHEMLKMGIWQKLLSQPLRYIYYIAGYVSPHRLRSASPPFRPPAPKPFECDLCALDVILNEQKPFHPSNVFSHSAMGHTRSFSSSVADRARRFPERNKARENQVDRSSRASAPQKPLRGASKRCLSDADLERRKTSRRVLKKQASVGEKPDSDPQTFSSKTLKAASLPMVTGRRRARPQDTVVPSSTESETSHSSRSTYLFCNRFSLPDHTEEPRQKLSLPIGIRAQRIKYRLWDTWIGRESIQGRLCDMQLFSVVTRSDADDHVGVYGL